MANQHPVIDGKTIEDAYTAAWVDAYFVPRETVRADYVPKDEHVRRLEAKDAAIARAKESADAAKTALLEAQGTSRQAQEAAAELAKLKQEITQRDDADALRIAGIVTEANEVDAGRAELLRFAFDKHVAGLDEDKRPADPVQGFRDWLKDPGGAKAHPHVGHWVNPGQAATAPVIPPGTSPVVKPAAPPNPNVGAVTPPTGGKMTPAQLQAFFASPAYLGLPPAEQQAKYKELSAQLTAGG